MKSANMNFRKLYKSNLLMKLKTKCKDNVLNTLFYYTYFNIDV